MNKWLFLGGLALGGGIGAKIGFDIGRDATYAVMAYKCGRDLDEALGGLTGLSAKMVKIAYKTYEKKQEKKK